MLHAFEARESDKKATLVEDNLTQSRTALANLKLHQQYHQNGLNYTV